MFNIWNNNDGNFIIGGKMKKKKKTSLKIIDNNIFKMLIISLLSLSVGLLSIYLMIGEINIFYKIITFIGSFIISYYFINKNYKEIVNKIKINKKYLFISLIASGIIFYELTISINNDVIMRFFNIKEIYYISFLGLYFIINLVLIEFKDWLYKFIKEMDTFEKKSFIIISIILFILLWVLYSNKVNFYHDYNVVYSIDSGDVYDKQFSQIHYYEIRHPLTSVLTFPVYAIVKFIFSTELEPVVMQFINSLLLLLTGYELKRLTKNKWVFIFYMLSFTSLLFMVFFEKYILSTFLLVTYLYNMFIEKKDGYKALIFAIGTLPTNIFIIIMEFFKKLRLKQRFENITTIIILAGLIVVVTGRIPGISSCVYDLGRDRGFYGGEEYTFLERFNSTTKMIETSLIAIPSEETTLTSLDGIDYQALFWKDITKCVSIVGLIILGIMALGIKDIIKKKKTIYYSFISGIVFAFILFVVLSWDIPESPLFTLCFSWAIIPLFIYGCEKIFNLVKLNTRYYKYIYICLLIVMSSINIYQFIDIYNYIQ